MAWTLQYYSGSAFTTPGVSIDNPWDTEVVDSNTDVVVRLADSTEGRITNATKSWQTMRLSWDMKSSDFEMD